MINLWWNRKACSAVCQAGQGKDNRARYTYTDATRVEGGGLVDRASRKGVAVRPLSKIWVIRAALTWSSGYDGLAYRKDPSRKNKYL